MDIRLIAFDLDGTLLGSDGKIPDKNAEALRECEKRGIRLMFCSGRAFEVQTEFAASIGINPVFASANGARIDAGAAGPTLRETPIGAELADRIYGVIKDAGLYFMSFTRGHTYMGNVDQQKRLQKHHHEPGVVRYAGAEYEIVGDPDRVERECRVSPYKFVCFGDDFDPRFDKIRERLSGLGLSMSSSWRDNLEIMRPGIDKGSALAFVMDRFAIPRECTMAFGDNTNDIPMLESVGWPVAMENAEDVLKQRARIIAPHHALGGVGTVISDMVLNDAT